MKTKEIYMYALGALVVASFMALLVVLVYVTIPETNSDLLNLSIGALIGYVGAVVNYFFGSSKGSADKNEMLKPKTHNDPPEN